MERQRPDTSSNAVELYIRTYSLLRSSGAYPIEWNKLHAVLGAHRMDATYACAIAIVRRSVGTETGMATERA